MHAFVVAALVATARAEDPPPEPSAMPALRRTASHVELRLGVPVVQELPYVPGGRDAPIWSPGLGVTAVAGKGSHVARVEAALHAAVAFAPWGALGRLEPRVGGRFGGDVGFLSLGLGASADRAGVVPVAHGALGWTGRGVRLRPVVAVEGRFALGPFSEEMILRLCPDGCAELEPGGTGVVVSAGVQWAGVKEGPTP